MARWCWSKVARTCPLLPFSITAGAGSWRLRILMATRMGVPKSSTAIQFTSRTRIVPEDSCPLLPPAADGRGVHPVVAAYDALGGFASNLQRREWRAGGDAQSLALADGEILDA